MQRKLIWLMITVSVVALGASLVIHRSLYLFGQQSYKDLHQVRLDPLGLGYFTDPPPPKTPGKVTAVFFGDSRAAQWPAPAGQTQIQFHNRGIGAQTSAQINGRFEAHIRPLNPDILILQIGINDLKTIPLFPQHRDQIVAQLEQNISAIVNQAHEMGTTVILTTIFPTGMPPLARRPVWSSEIDTAVNEVNQFIRSLADEDVLILDAGLLLEDDAGQLKPGLAVDELHLNEAGYQALNEVLIPLLTTFSSHR